MPITTIDHIVQGLTTKRQPLMINKAALANANLGQIFALWRGTGSPPQGNIPAAAAICDGTLVGAMAFAAATGGDVSVLAGCAIANSNVAGDVNIFDRLAHMGGLNGTLTTAQTVGVAVNGVASNMVQRIGNADYSSVSWWLEWYTDTGPTAANASINVTYNDGTTGTLALAVVPTACKASRRVQIAPAVAGKWIRSVDTLTLSANTTVAGSFGVTACRLLGIVPLGLANLSVTLDWAQLRLPPAHPSACLELSIMTGSTATSTGTLYGSITLIQG